MNESFPTSNICVLSDLKIKGFCNGNLLCLVSAVTSLIGPSLIRSDAPVVTHRNAACRYETSSKVGKRLSPSEEQRASPFSGELHRHSKQTIRDISHRLHLPANFALAAFSRARFRRHQRSLLRSNRDVQFTALCWQD